MATTIPETPLSDVYRLNSETTRLIILFHGWDLLLWWFLKPWWTWSGSRTPDTACCCLAPGSLKREYTITVALFPGLHAQLCRLQYEKRGEGLERFITWCMPLLTSCSVCSRLGLFSPLHSSFPELSSFFLFSLSCESNCFWINRG